MIVCCGEALIDMVPTSLPLSGADTREWCYQARIGGAPFNTALGLAQLGARVGFASGFSNDRFGAVLWDALSEASVDLSLSRRTDLATALAFVHLVEGQACYQFYDEMSAGRHVTFAPSLKLPASVSAILCGGISLAMEPCAAAYESLVKRFETQQPAALRMIDPNIRPDFIKNESDYRSRLDRFFQHCPLVKLSDEDFDWLVPAVSQEVWISDRLNSGTELILRTHGANGATAYRLSRGDIEALHVPACATEVVDTIGAGDIFNAAFLYGLVKILAIEKVSLNRLETVRLMDCLSFAVSLASLSTQKAGAGLPETEKWQMVRNSFLARLTADR